MIAEFGWPLGPFYPAHDRWEENSYDDLSFTFSEDSAASAMEMELRKSDHNGDSNTISNGVTDEYEDNQTNNNDLDMQVEEIELEGMGAKNHEESMETDVEDDHEGGGNNE